MSWGRPVLRAPRVMQKSLLVLIAIATGPTVRVEMSFGVALTAKELGRWQVLNTGVHSVGSGRYAPGPSMIGSFSQTRLEPQYKPPNTSKSRLNSVQILQSRKLRALFDTVARILVHAYPLRASCRDCVVWFRSAEREARSISRVMRATRQTLLCLQSPRATAGDVAGRRVASRNVSTCSSVGEQTCGTGSPLQGTRGTLHCSLARVPRAVWGLPQRGYPEQPCVPCSRVVSAEEGHPGGWS